MLSKEVELTQKESKACEYETKIKKLKVEFRRYEEEAEAEILQLKQLISKLCLK